MKTSESQLEAVARYQDRIYGWDREENREVRIRRRGQVYRSNGKTWAKKYASREELEEYMDELALILRSKRF